MKKNATFILFFALIPVLLFAQNSVLVISKASHQDLLPYKPDLRVYYVSDDFKIFEISRDKLDFLDSANLDYKIIDENGWNENYYILSQHAQSPRFSKINSDLIKYRNEHIALIQANQQTIEKLAAENFDVVKIDRTPKPLKKPAPFSLTKPAGDPDPTILSIIDKVSVDSLEAFLTRLQNFYTRYTLSDSINVAGQWIYDKYRSFGYTDVKFDTFYLYNEPHRNIIVTKPGLIYPDSVIMIGGHYDCISSNSYTNRNGKAPGAEDDGSGTVSAIEMARVLADIDFEATIKFAAWDAEELGLIGSRAYVQKIYNQNLPVSFYLNFDMIGYQSPDDPNRDIQLYTNDASRPFAEFVADMARTYTTLIPTIPSRNSGGSDHFSFQQFGYHAIFGFEGAYDFSHNPHYHQPTDLVENMDLDFYRENVQMGLAAIATLAGPTFNVENQPYVKLKDYIIDDDNVDNSQGNGNSYIDPGEKIELILKAKNFGGVDATGVQGVLQTQDPLVTIIDSLVAFGNIQSETMVQSTNKPVIQIDNDAPSNHKLKFTLLITDADQNSWDSRFDLFVLSPQFSFEGINWTEVAGNGDQKIDPGETVNLSILLRNTGDRDATNIHAILRAKDENITIIDSLAVFPDAAKEQVSENQSDQFKVSISSSASNGIIPLSLEIFEGQDYYRQTLSLNFGVGQTPVLVVEDDNTIDVTEYYFDTMKKYGIPFRHWDTSVEGTVPLDTLVKFQRVVWYTSAEIKSSLFYSGAENLEQYLDQGGRLFMNGSTLALTLITKPLLSDYFFCKYISYQTNLHHLLATETNPILAEDSFWLSTSDENSQSLTGEIDPLEMAQPILLWDQNSSEGPGNIRSSGTAAVSVEKDNYRAVFFAFGWEGIEPENVRENVMMEILAWLQGDISAVQNEKMALTLPTEFSLNQNFPNPFNSRTQIAFELPRRSKVEIKIYNLQGQLIRVMANKTFSAGHHKLLWDGMDSGNKKAASGIYFYRLKTRDFSQTRKMILLY